MLIFCCMRFQENYQKQLTRKSRRLWKKGYDELPKFFGDLLADYINWVKLHTKTVYQGVYSMEEYFSHENSTGAYEEQIYLKILYYLYNPDYIEQNKMYQKSGGFKKLCGHMAVSFFHAFPMCAAEYRFDSYSTSTYRR